MIKAPPSITRGCVCPHRWQCASTWMNMKVVSSKKDHMAKGISGLSSQTTLECWVVILCLWVSFFILYPPLPISELDYIFKGPLRKSSMSTRCNYIWCVQCYNYTTCKNCWLPCEVVQKSGEIGVGEIGTGNHANLGISPNLPQVPPPTGSSPWLPHRKK